MKKRSTPIQVQRAMYLVRQEKNGELAGGEKSEKSFSTWISENSKALDEATGSLPRRILHVMCRKWHETMAAAGWLNLVHAREIQGECRLLNLAKAHQNQAESGWPNLIKARDIQSKLFEARANAKWQAIKYGPLLVWKESTGKLDQKCTKRFLELDGQPWKEVTK